MNLNNVQIISIVILIPIVLSVMMILEGLKNIVQAKGVSIPKNPEQLDDESLISGKQRGCIGTLYIASGITFLGVIVYVYMFLTR